MTQSRDTCQGHFLSSEYILMVVFGLCPLRPVILELSVCPLSEIRVKNSGQRNQTKETSIDDFKFQTYQPVLDEVFLINYFGARKLSNFNI